MSMIFFALFGSLFLLLFMGCPIAISLGVSAVAGMYFGDMPYFMFIQRLYSTFDSFPLMAVPFFILAGEIMQKGTIADTLLKFCQSLIGHVRGGLSHISILTCLFYGALSGSAPATTAAVGGIMIPAMEKEGYPKAYATAINCAGGCLGVIIPPSVPLIIYASTVGVSVTDIFIASIMPGILCGLGLMLVGYIYAVLFNYGQKHKKATAKERFEALWVSKWALMMPIIVLGSIYGGIATPTEAGCVAVVYAFVIELFVTKSIDIIKFKGIILSSIRTISSVFAIVCCANAFSIILVYYNAQDVITTILLNISANKYIVLPIILSIIFILGTFLETVVIILVLGPMLMPVIMSLGIDPIHFGVTMLVMLTVGFLTPPVGVNLFIGATISGTPISTLSVAILPFIAALIVCNLIVAFVPQLSLIFL